MGAHEHGATAFASCLHRHTLAGVLVLTVEHDRVKKVHVVDDEAKLEFSRVAQ
jgi:hypothetical protein